MKSRRFATYTRGANLRLRDKTTKTEDLGDGIGLSHGVGGGGRVEAAERGERAGPPRSEQ
ncbi:hypothetical protein ACFYO0_03705 [Streptomyces sp. NPDC006365]|uniref:hypothetical protein n=1 Tax=Streptomyces sp. NPDC006365 TaxID=3364744 RepID=UPI00369A205A